MGMPLCQSLWALWLDAFNLYWVWNHDCFTRIEEVLLGLPFRDKDSSVACKFQVSLRSCGRFGLIGIMEFLGRVRGLMMRFESW